MNLEQRIKYQLDNKKFCQLKRKVGENSFVYSNGYILDHSEHFLLVQDVADFSVAGYLVFPIATLIEIRYNANDKYYDKIIQWENLLEQVSNKYKIDLTDWTSIFRTIKKSGLNVIVENENPEEDTFLIGPIVKTSKTAAYIRYFNGKGILDPEPSRISFDKITMVKFDDPYINVFSKYLREAKAKP